MSVLVTTAQVVSAVAAAAAAAAAWVSASASMRTAGRADATARRALEALGRATMPVLRVEIGNYPATEREAGRGPVPVTLFVVNEGINRGLIQSAEVRRPDGITLIAREPMPVEIGPIVGVGEQINAIHLHMGAMPRLLPDARRDTDSAPAIAVSVEFTDSGRAVHWRHRSQWAEWARFDADGDPVYSYMQVGRADVDMIGEEPAVAQRLSWDQTTWRFIR